MLKKIKRIAACITGLAVILTCTGCTIGKGTANALTVDGTQVKSGIYIYYSYSALQEAISKAKENDSSIKEDDEKALKKCKIDGTDFMTWIQDKATDNCAYHVAVNKHFDELKLTLSDEDKEKLEQYVDSSWEQNGDMFTKSGISKESIHEVMETSFKSDEIFDAYYGEGGSKGITDEQVREYYEKNNARVKYVKIALTDSNGNNLEDKELQNRRDMADDYLERAKTAAGKGNQELLDEFDAIISDYKEYESSYSAESSGTDEETEASTESTEASTEAAAESSSAGASETTSASGSDSDKTTTTTVATTTTAASESGSETGTTTTTNPFANENIIQAVTTAEGETEEDLTYTPCEKVYKAAFDEKTKTDAPEIIEDKDTKSLYVMVKLDITDRMNEDDLWSEDGSDNARSAMFSKEAQDMIEEWADAYKVERNERAYKRYDPFDIEDESATQ